MRGCPDCEEMILAREIQIYELDQQIRKLQSEIRYVEQTVFRSCEH